jgi:glycerophosphoryl diester phosphodiesterase
MKIHHSKAMMLTCLFSFIQLAPKRLSYKGHNPFRSLRPLIVGHRGSRMLFPENTLFAFRAAFDLGVDMLEMDVRLTRDGQLVVHHDATIERTSDGCGKIIHHSFKDLTAYNFGAKFIDMDGNQPYLNTKIEISKLKTVFEAFPHLPMIIDIKDPGIIGELAIDQINLLIKQFSRYDETIVASFSNQNIRYMKTFYPKLYTSTAEGDVRKYVSLHTLYLDWFYKSSNCSLQLPVEKSGFNLSSNHFIDSIHKRNMAVHYWTINDPDEMRRLLALKVDGIITDRPDLLLKIIKSSDSQ